MSSGLLSEKILQKDGTGQQQRQKAALQPDFIPMEERSLPDWIHFAKEYAKSLRFFNEDNQATGTWEGFLANVDTNTLLRYVENPAAFSADQATAANLSRPHLVLFVTFLQLLGYIKTQINGFTKKHLDFYYYNILGLTLKGPVPDEAHVIIKLADDVNEWLLEKGTGVLAGQDSHGNDLIYATGRDTLITSAKVQKIKTLYTGRVTTTMLQVKGKNTQERLMQMFKLALGNPHPGDELPHYENNPVNITLLEKLRADKTKKKSYQQYVEEQLHLYIGELDYILQVYNTPAADWAQIAYYLKKAYTKKIASYSKPDAALSEADFVLLEPELVTWENGYAVADALAAAFTSGSEEKATRYFNTFGKTGAEDEKRAAQPISVGFAITSPLLLLQEGTRTITVTLQFVSGTPLNKNIFPFAPYLSTSDGWLQIPKTQFSFSSLEMTENDIVYLQIILTIELTKTDPAIGAPAITDTVMSIRSSDPVLGLILQPGEDAGSNYGLYKSLQLQKVKVSVTVIELIALTLQNDDGILNYKKPFDPFGVTPAAGSRFYFAHPEISGKPLSSLTLHFDWSNAPADLSKHYAGYGKTVNDNSLQNNSFTADVKYVNEGLVHLLQSGMPLFEKSNASKPNAETIDISGLSFLTPATAEEAINWQRYFSLELNAPGFQQQEYAQKLLNTVGSASATLLNPPYKPRLQSFTVDYKTDFEIPLDTYSTDGISRLMHINAFGYKQMSTKPKKAPGEKAEPVYFLPQYDYAGELYIGISNINVPQNLSLFFQLAEGSANPELDKPAVHWSVLCSNDWQPLKGASLVSDTTNGLFNTGIVELAIPSGATNHNTLLGEGLYWLRAAVLTNTDAIPDTVNILAQGISAVFIDNENAPDHYLSLLPPESIKETVALIPEIKKISQPYSSSKGKPGEEDTQFYTRVSERLRHKDRALTMWDYEHLVLEQFPEIYKAKCIPADAAGSVDVIVIPDIRGKLPFNPFEPKAPSNVIAGIEQYLAQRAPAWAGIRVKNPSYIQVKVRIAIKIKEGLSETFFFARLEKELIRYLAPWAYNEGADIYLDTRLDADVIVNFVAERPYVAFASDIHLFVRKGSEGDFVLQYPNATGEYYVQATAPGDILVSAASHEIDLIREYKANDYRGIGYMKVGLDFKIG